MEKPRILFLCRIGGYGGMLFFCFPRMGFPVYAGMFSNFPA